MKISEAIKFIVDQNDKKILTDSKKFNSYLLDLCSDNLKELKIVKRALEDEILERIFGNERDNVKIARLRDEFEDQGMSEEWSEFVISSFAEALGWNYIPKVQNQQVQQNQMDWTCSCGTVNNGNFCGNCGKSKPVTKNTTWTCFCGTVNKTKFCTNCGKTEQQVEEARRKANPFTSANVGEYVKFGHYSQSANGDIQSIEWLVLVRENNKILVISRYGLEARRFDSSSNNWKNSQIHRWLNGEFYDKSFNEEEKKFIRYSSISTSVYKYKKKSGLWGSLLGQEDIVESNELTDDKVFLLSAEETEKYFINDDLRKCKPTEYAVKNGADVNMDNGCCLWWLRSTTDSFDYYRVNYISCVNYDGIIHSYLVDKKYCLVRPALWINL